MLLPQSSRLARRLLGIYRLLTLHQLPEQMAALHWCSRFPRVTSYCVELTLRRLCSTRPAESEKPKLGKKSGAKSKKSLSTDYKEPPPEKGEETPVKKAKRTKKTAGEGKPKTKAELFSEHVEKEPASVQRLLHQFDVQLNRQKHEPDIFYIVNESIADRVVRQLSGRSLEIPHLEIGPGPGVLTRRLLQAGVRQVIGFEPAPVFQHCVRDLSEQTGDAVRLTPLNLLQLSKFHGAATQGDDTRARQAMAGLTHRAWGDAPCLRVVGVAHRTRFFQFLVRSIIGRDHLFQFGRPELLVFVPEMEYERLSAGPAMAGRVYRPYSIVSRMLFDLEPLDRVPAKHFYPWMKSRKKVEFSESAFVLIRYTPKAEPGVPESELPNLDFFVRHCASSSTRRILPQMEEWVPGCGPRLIALGHGVFSPFRELEPDQLLSLFLEFTSWPEYPACSFHAAVQQNVLGAGSELADSDPLAGEDGHEAAEDFQPETFS